MTRRQTTWGRQRRGRGLAIGLMILFVSILPGPGDTTGAHDASGSPPAMLITGGNVAAAQTATRPDARSLAGRQSVSHMAHGAGFAVVGVLFVLAEPYESLRDTRAGSLPLVVDGVDFLWRGRAPPGR